MPQLKPEPAPSLLLYSITMLARVLFRLKKSISYCFDFFIRDTIDKDNGDEIFYPICYTISFSSQRELNYCAMSLVIKQLKGRLLRIGFHAHE